MCALTGVHSTDKAWLPIACRLEIVTCKMVTAKCWLNVGQRIYWSWKHSMAIVNETLHRHGTPMILLVVLQDAEIITAWPHVYLLCSGPDTVTGKTVGPAALLTGPIKDGRLLKMIVWLATSGITSSHRKSKWLVIKPKRIRYERHSSPREAACHASQSPGCKGR